MSQELFELSWREPTLPFGNVAWYGDGRAANLAGKTINFVRREILCMAVNLTYQCHAFLPSDKILVGLPAHFVCPRDGDFIRGYSPGLQESTESSASFPIQERKRAEEESFCRPISDSCD
jgi:hypothetical protein